MVLFLSAACEPPAPSQALTTITAGAFTNFSPGRDVMSFLITKRKHCFFLHVRPWPCATPNMLKKCVINLYAQSLHCLIVTSFIQLLSNSIIVFTTRMFKQKTCYDCFYLPWKMLVFQVLKASKLKHMELRMKIRYLSK